MEENKYIPGKEAVKFIAFVRASGNETHSSPEVHYKIADGLFSTEKEDRKLLIECTRGLGKSTLTEYAVIYAAAIGEWPGFGKVPFIVFLGASQEGNVKQFFKNVASKVKRSDFISSVLEVKRQTDTELELVNSDGVETIITGRGMSTNFRGLRSKSGDRPTMVIADDILSNEVATSDTISSTIDTNWYNSVLPALDPTKHKIIYIGTPISEKDLMNQLKKSGAYRVERYPLCSGFPCQKSEYDSIWPDRFSYEYTRDMYRQYESAGKTQGFYQEYLLEMTDLSTLLVNKEDIKWYDPAKVVKNRDNYNFYISTDFATSTKKSADFSTIGVWAINNNGDWMLVDGQCKRQSMQENLDDLFKYVARWKPLSVGIESSGQQGGFISILEDMMINRNTWFTIAKKRGSRDYGIRPSGDKVTRFVTGVQPMFKQGKVWFPKPELTEKANPRLFELVEEMEHELSKLTLAGGVKAIKHDDAIDLLNQLSEMDMFKPSEQTNASERIDGYLDNDGELWWPEEKEEDYGGSTIF
jgi:phage terminase large subunit-like protein